MKIGQLLIPTFGHTVLEPRETVKKLQDWWPVIGRYFFLYLTDFGIELPIERLDKVRSGDRSIFYQGTDQK